MCYGCPSVPIHCLSRIAIDRAYTVQREQERLRKSLGKYNNFVREKAAKVEDGDRLYAEEVEFQESIEQRIREKTNLVQELEGAKASEEDGIMIRSSVSARHAETSCRI